MPSETMGNEAGRRANVPRPLTHSLDSTKEGLAMQATRTCTVPDCGRILYSKGYCRTHYERAKKHGDPHTVKKGGPQRKTPTPCTIPNCPNNARAKGLCPSHYNLQARYGDPTTPKRLPYFGVPFWDRVEIIDDPTSCWPWKAGKGNADGRGRMRWNGKTEMAYRIAWTLTYGPIPPGMYVCHHCDNPPCVRPDHLFLGTPRDNTQDMIRKGRKAAVDFERAAGDDHALTRTPDEEIARIRARHATGISQAQLVRETGISQSHMSRILRGTSRTRAGGTA